MCYHEGTQCTVCAIENQTRELKELLTQLLQKKEPFYVRAYKNIRHKTRMFFLRRKEAYRKRMDPYEYGTIESYDGRRHKVTGKLQFKRIGRKDGWQDVDWVFGNDFQKYQD